MEAELVGFSTVEWMMMRALTSCGLLQYWPPAHAGGSDFCSLLTADGSLTTASGVHKGAVEAVAHISGDKGGSHLCVFDDFAGEELIEGRVEDLDPTGEMIGEER